MSILKKLVLALLVLGIAGCGGDDGPKVYPVKGTVTIDGQPQADLFVSFSPVGGDKTEGAGLSGNDGSFTVTSGSAGREGLEPGQYAVYLRVKPGAGPAEGTETYENPAAGKGGPAAPFPQEWGGPATTPLKVEVKPESNTIDVEVSSSGG